MKIGVDRLLFLAFRNLLISFHVRSNVHLLTSCSIMPRAKSAKTLLELSIAHVVQSMNKWEWKPIEISDTISDSELVQSPLHQLPLHVLEKIVQHLQMNYLLSKHLKWVITSQLSELILISHDEKEIHVQLKHASIQCPLLKKLKLKTWKKPDIETSIVQFLPKFQQLEVLEIANTTVRDNSLEVFGTYFKHLRELDVSYCPGVTDNGIQRLCGGAHHLEGESRRKEYIWDYGKCKLIQKLRVKGTSVTKKGIQIALQNLPSLKVLSHELVVEVLSNIHQSALKSNPPLIPKYSLIKIAVAGPHTQGSFGLALALCPSVIKVKIEEIKSDFLNSDLLELLKLASLRHLQIKCFNPSSVTFYDGVFPLLKAKGNLLESLKLEMFSDVDIHSIIEFCPNLNSLAIDNCKFCEIPVEEKDSFVRWKRIKIEPPILRKLEVLRLILESPFQFNAESILLQLLSSPSLRILEILYCNELTDSILETVVLRHHFQNLAQLELYCCNSLTKKGIDFFMNDNNSIKYMDLTFEGDYSELLTVENFYEWEEKRIQKNWQLILNICDVRD